MALDRDVWPTQPWLRRLLDVEKGVREIGLKYRWLFFLSIYSVIRFNCGHARNIAIYLCNQHQYKGLSTCIRMQIIIDARETRLIEHAKNTGLIVSVRSMALGDAAIVDDSGAVQLYIERKTLVDLSASIGDGRYKDQASRFCEVPIERKRIFYVVEGSIDEYERNTNKHRLPYSTLVSAMLSLAVSSGFSVHRTAGIAETAKWLAYVRDKMRRMAKASPLPVTISSAPTRASSITKDNIELRMLCQLPGISEKTGTAILSSTGSLGRFISRLTEDPEVLKTIQIVGPNGKTRKIPSKCIDTARSLLL